MDTGANYADQLLATLTNSLQQNLQVKALWMAGSRGRGTADAFSDLDLWVAIEDAAMQSVIDEPLAFVHAMVPTVMHILAPGIAPVGGAFLGCWVPVGDEFVQVDWYFTPASTATRDSDTKMIFGDVHIPPSREERELPLEIVLEKAEQNLVFALQMINNMVKHARRGASWRMADHARHADACLLKAEGYLNHNKEPGFDAAHRTFLPEPVSADVHDVQTLADHLLDQVDELAKQGDIFANLESAIGVERAVVRNWRASGWKPTEEYYRTLPRRYVGAGMFFTDTEDRILLLETTYKDQFEIPGGICEEGESPADAAGREVREELGLSIQPGQLLVMDHRSQPAPKGDALTFVYDGGVISDTDSLRPDQKEIARTHFISLDDIGKYVTPNMATRLHASMRSRAQNRLIELTDGIERD